MTLTILAFAALAAVYAVITKAEPAQALAGETTISDAVAGAKCRRWAAPTGSSRP
jgi:hypothetical protein